MVLPDNGLPGLLPEPPLVSSDIGWEGIAVEHHRQPCFGTPEHSLLRHLVTVQLGEPVRAETMVEGRLQRWRWRPGDVSVVPAGVPNRESWESTTEYVAVRLDPAVIARSAEASSDAQDVELATGFGLRDPLLHHLLLALLAEARTGEDGEEADRCYVEAMVTALSVHLLKNHATYPSTPGRYAPSLPGSLSRTELVRVADYVEDNLSQNLSLTELAESVEMSTYRLSRLFKRSTGLTPYQYIVHRRVEKAKRLLKDEGLSLFDVSRSAGFSDQSHFTRHFKRLVGATPGEFRRQLRR